MLDTVDSGRNELRDGLLTEAVRRYAASQFMCASDRRFGHISRPQRCQITNIPIDPIPYEFHPAIAAASLPLYLGNQLVRLHFLAVVAEISLGSGDVPPGADDSREVFPIVHPPGIGGAARIPKQQRSGVAVGNCLLFGPLIGDGALPLQTDVTMRIHKAGHHPNARGNGLCVADRLKAN
jgi:hypothetical protein